MRGPSGGAKKSLASYFYTLYFKKKIFLKGLGFRTNILDDLGIVEFKLGFSHLIRMKIPQDIKMKTRKSFIHIEGKDNVSLGNFVNKIIY